MKEVVPALMIHQGSAEGSTRGWKVWSIAAVDSAHKQACGAEEELKAVQETLDQIKQSLDDPEKYGTSKGQHKHVRFAT